MASFLLNAPERSRLGGRILSRSEGSGTEDSKEHVPVLGTKQRR